MAQQIKKKYLSQEIISYFDDQIASEQAAREAADSALESKAEQDLEQAVSDLEAADASLQQSISEVSSDLESEISRVEGLLSDEVSARESADLSLDSKIDDEIAAREAADSSLQSQINNIISNTDPAALDSLSEIVSAFQSADGNLNQVITDLATSAASALQAEIDRAESEESRIEAKVDQEILDRAAAIVAEVAAREAADALKEDSANKSTDSALGDSDVLFPTQKAVKDHVLNKESSLARKLLTGKEIESLIPASVNVETADRHYSGGVVHALNPDYACYFTDQSLVFVDARNPFAVNIYKTITFSTAANNFPQAMTAIGNYLYMTMSNGRVYPIDWSDLENPSLLAFTAIGTGQHYDVATDGNNTMFIANTSNSRVYIVDITTRTAPVLITSIALGGFGTGVTFHNGHLYVTNYSNKLHTIKKNDTTGVWEQIAVLDTITQPNRCRIVENSRGEKLLFAMRYNGVDAAFYNISNPALPVEVKRLVTSSAMQIYAVPFSHENMVHVGLVNGTVGGFSIVDVTDPKIAGAYTPVNPDGSKKFSEMRVLIKAATKSPYFKDKALLLASGVRVGGTNTQKTTAPIQLPVINHDLVELLARPTSSSVSGSIASEAQARIDADNALDARLDVIEGSGVGSIQKSLQDSKDYADQKVAALVGSAPAVLDTLKELADALGGDENFAATVASQIGAVDSKVDSEISRAQAAELALDEKIDTNSSAISQEVLDRQAADADLQSQIDALNGNFATDAELADAVSSLQDYVNSAVSSEESARISADESLQSAIDSEASTRAEADDALQSSIDILDSNKVERGGDTMTGPLSFGSAGEGVSYSSVGSASALFVGMQDGELVGETIVHGGLVTMSDADGNSTFIMPSKIELVNSDGEPVLPVEDYEVAVKKYVDNGDASLQSAIDAEVSARETADSALQSQIDNIISNTDPAVLDSLSEIVEAFQSADGNLTQLITDLGTSSASALQSEIDRAEGEEARIEGKVDQEILDRTSADQSLQSSIDDLDAYAQDIRSDVDDHESRIDALEALNDGPIFHKAKIVIGAELAFVDLPHSAIENSIVASVGRLMIHKDEDFTVSIVGGVSRLTFINSLANPGGDEKIETGDVIFVTYAVIA